jgi:L-fucose mutarotase
MLKGIPPILGPDLLYILRAMGHGDEIAIVDANYPGDSAGPQLVRLDGISASEVLDAILTVMPLDTFVDEQAFGMEVVGDAKKREETHKDFAKLIKKHEPGMKLSLLSASPFMSACTAPMPWSRPASGASMATSCSRRASFAPNSRIGPHPPNGFDHRWPRLRAGLALSP